MNTINQKRSMTSRVATAIMAASSNGDVLVDAPDGESLARSYQFVVEHLQHAAALGDVGARNDLAIMLLEPAVGEPDYNTAAKLLLESARHRDVEGMFLLGLLLLDEYYSGVYKHRTFRLWREAASAGMPIAQHGLALLFEKGLGTTASEAEAIRWYKRALDGGVDQRLARLLEGLFLLIETASAPEIDEVRSTPNTDHIATMEFERIPSSAVF